MRGLKAIIIFETKYGNTEKIARSLEMGLSESGIQTECVAVRDMRGESLGEYDLICIGAPTESHTASRPMRDYLENLKPTDLTGKFGFAFDTSPGRPFSGSAAKFIEGKLTKKGAEIVASHESAIVIRQKGEKDRITMKQGEQKRFERIGRNIGEMLKSK